MTKISLPCKHVSHTAWLVAAYRAQESKRVDAHFHDPLAAKLIEDLEEEYLAGFSKELRTDSWFLTVRTHYIDKLIQQSIDQGIKIILNLGAGLDTRPYRLSIPSNTLWIEADYGEVIDYKNNKLKNDRSRCELERIAVDLSVTKERQKVLNRISELNAPTLILTEGLIIYLHEENVRELAEELYAMEKSQYWLADVCNESMLRSLHGDWKKDLNKDGEVFFYFVPKSTANFLRPFGWQLKEFTSFADGALKLMRLPRGQSVDDIKNDKGLHESGICLFEAQKLL